MSDVVSEVIQVTLPSGHTILARAQSEGPVDVGAGGTLRKLHLDDLRQTVEGVTQSVAQALQRVAPDDVSLEFGIELAVKTGKLTSVLAEGSGKASIKLTLTWSSRDALRTSVESEGDEEGGDNQADPDS